jgi:hypothetical protein
LLGITTWLGRNLTHFLVTNDLLGFEHVKSFNLQGILISLVSHHLCLLLPELLNVGCDLLVESCGHPIKESPINREKLRQILPSRFDAYYHFVAI